jgi:hypothetical protein
MEPHLYQERLPPVNRLTNLGSAVLGAFVCLAAIVVTGGVPPAHASSPVSWHQQSQVATEHCPRFGGCYYTYQDVGYVANESTGTMSSSLTGVIDAGARSRTLQLAHGTVITFDGGATVTA